MKSYRIKIVNKGEETLYIPQWKKGILPIWHSFYRAIYTGIFIIPFVAEKVKYTKKEDAINLIELQKKNDKSKKVTIDYDYEV